MVGLTSASGVVGFLFEPDHELQIFALRKLNEEIDSLWTEVVNSIGQIETLYEDSTFPERELAALVAAKVYYNIQEYSESMVFALNAGNLFDLDHDGEFEDTIISKCVDTYIALSEIDTTPITDHPPSKLTTAFPSTAYGASSTSASLTSPTTPFTHVTLPSRSLLSREYSTITLNLSMERAGDEWAPPILPVSNPFTGGIEEKLHAMIDKLFERCFRNGRYRQVVGIAVEARKLDVLRRSIQRASEDERKEKKSSESKLVRGEDLLEYLLEICMNVVQERSLRNEVCGSHTISSSRSCHMLITVCSYCGSSWTCSTTYHLLIASLSQNVSYISTSTKWRQICLLS